MNQQKFSIPKQEIADFCKRWKISEFAIFGSALREDFQSESDLDVLVTFAANAEWGLLDQVRMEQELSALFQRKIDLFSRSAVEQNHNWLRRREILETAEVIYVS